MTEARLILDQVTRVRRRELMPEICQMTNNRVLSGPFAGMQISEQSSWGDGDAAPKLLGVYEQELHESVEKMIAANPQLVVNVGCAEGYYAIGLARRLPDARVVAFDISQSSLDVAAINAITNQVENLEVGNSCSAEELDFLLDECDVALVVSDCEGYETELLNPGLAPSLSKAYILVESHDMFVPGITQTLCERFAGTHDITIIRQGARDPYQFTELEKYSDSDKWALVNELRGETMNWVYMEPK